HALSLSLSAHHRDLHSFPTRRSSDLEVKSTCTGRSPGIPHDGLGAKLDQRYAVRYRRHRYRIRQRHLGRLREAQLRTLHQPDSIDRKSTRLNSSHVKISYAVFCLKKK